MAQMVQIHVFPLLLALSFQKENMIKTQDDICKNQEENMCDNNFKNVKIEEGMEFLVHEMQSVPR